MVWHEVRRYAFAVLTVAVAVLFARALDRYISPHVSPPYFLAVMLSAAYAGAGPGLVATVLSSLAIAWFDLGTTHNLNLGLDDLIRLAIFALADRRDAIVEVADDGEGIEDELLRHVFDRFTQGRDGIRKGGLGLGLSIARHIVELHEGSIDAYSAGRNRGSTFTVRLPLVRDIEGRRVAERPVVQHL